MDSIVAEVSEAGGLNLPVRFREKLGLEHGGSVVVTLDGAELRLQPTARVFDDLQRDFSRFFQDPPSPVDELLAARRSEARSEG